ncbi:MAG: LPXTG cell wall anchor domain-containing protein [Proteobacteria bacterium]|nr:LPXTG cell wall anchor domain-containing protein [Pseudomonadota bacterium]
MSLRIVSTVAAVALGVSASAFAQSPTDRTFTATGTRCEDVNWSNQTLARYPRVAKACQSVVQRDGKYFVVFSGTVTGVARHGRELTVEFKDGDRVTLNPPSDMMVDIEGTMTRAHDLQRRQELTFYVPQDQFVAEVPEGKGVSVPIPITQWEPPSVADAAPESTESRPAELPKTGTDLGLLALGGLALVLTGAAVTTARYRRGIR